MPTTFVKGDLFRYSGLNAFAHGCNCAGAMGKGIAVQFRARFPAMYAEYKQRCATGRFNPGDVFAWSEDGVTVFNLGTQKTWRTKAELGSIETALTTMVGLAQRAHIARIGLPRIGSGLGGLPWESIRALLAKMGVSTDIELVVFEEYAP